ncbi:hypothetical protein KKC04_04580 [Patescibacteria group bacterium]|nr:hypothetical protein [Patescibacteria group bacterium]
MIYPIQSALIFSMSFYHLCNYISTPVAVKVYRDEDFFFAENENLAVCGTGDTPQDANTRLDKTFY